MMISNKNALGTDRARLLYSGWIAIPFPEPDLFLLYGFYLQDMPAAALQDYV